jgi:GTPase
MFEFVNKTIPQQRKEDNNGNREYKMYLDLALESKTEIKKNKNKSNDYINFLREQKLFSKINKRASQLLYRLEEGHGKAIYMIGVKDDGTAEGIDIELLFKSMNFLYRMIEILNAKLKNLRIYKGSAENKYVCTARIEIPKYKQKQLPVI